MIITRVPSNAMDGNQLKASAFTCVIPGLGWLEKLSLSPHGLQLVTEHHSQVSHIFYCCLALKRQEEKCQAWYVLYLELAQCHFFNTLLVKRVTGFVDNEGDGEAGFSFLWESGKPHCRRAWGMEVIAVVIFGK